MTHTRNLSINYYCMWGSFRVRQCVKSVKVFLGAYPICLIRLNQNFWKCKLPKNTYAWLVRNKLHKPWNCTLCAQHYMVWYTLGSFLFNGQYDSISCSNYISIHWLLCKGLTYLCDVLLMLSTNCILLYSECKRT